MYGIQINHICRNPSTYSIIWPGKWEGREMSICSLLTIGDAQSTHTVVSDCLNQQEGLITEDAALNKWDIKFTHP